MHRDVASVELRMVQDIGWKRCGVEVDEKRLGIRRKHNHLPMRLAFTNPQTLLPFWSSHLVVGGVVDGVEKASVLT